MTRVVQDYGERFTVNHYTYGRKLLSRILIRYLVCDGDDDAMEYIHMENYHLLIEIIAEATFSWLACGSCVKESTKMIEERLVI